MLRLGSLFSGSGGFELAGSLCGIEPVFASEVEPYPIAVTRSRFPDVKHLGDISKVSGYEIEPVDIITFGSPCQDLSIAGKRAGLKHEANGDEETTRSGLFMEAVRIIKEMREATNGLYPRFALWENVPGAFSSNKGEDFRIVLEELIKIVEPEAVMPAVPAKGWAYADSYIGDGWSLAYRVFDAQYWGVPQRRRRIHLVLDLGGGCARKVLFERDGVRGDFAEGRAPWQGPAGDAQNCAGADDRERNGGVIGTFQNTGVGWWNESDIGATIRTPSGGDSTLANVVAEVLPFDTTQVTSPKNGNNPKWGDPCHPLAAQGHPPTVCCKESVVLFEPRSQYGVPRIHGEVSPTLNTAQGGQRQPCVAQCQNRRYTVRRLTPIECARLQGFADWWGDVEPKDDFTEEEYRFWLDVRNTHAAINGKPQKDYTKPQMLTWYNKLHTDSAEYKMWGNGIALPPALYCMQGMVETMEGKTQ